ncbi:F-box domain protein [Ancylostoma caninum]|uniref:F-box domain protein n=1 Tax=Ancylostoma caninum TaxID=29170 RepID=A0A368FT31_ANCCA|nr:F-box domain protein [Ancylostoma caninum]
MTCGTADATMSSSAPVEALPGRPGLTHSPRRCPLSEVVFLPDSVLTPDSSQLIPGVDGGVTNENGFTSLNERKRHRDSSEAMDVDSINKIRMKPDILTFYRTPGAFKFCRRVSSGPSTDYFHTSNRGGPLPENVVVEILSYLNKRDLCNAMATCRLLYSSGSRCRTWEHVDLFNRTVFNHSLICFLNRRLKIMRMADTNVENWPYGSSVPSISLEYPLMLTHLDLSRAVFADRSLLVNIMKGCTRLQALSMEGQDMGEDALEICTSIGRNHSLTRLDLSMTVGITAKAAQEICLGCTIVQHLNLSWSSLDQQTVLVFCSNLPDSVTRLNMAGSLNKSSLDDEAIERLVICCPNIKELDLSDNVNITERGLQFLISLHQLESLSLNRCYGIQPMNFLMCGHLYALNVFGCITDSGLAALKNGLSETEVNGAVFNYIAKPTVPPAVTSIWVFVYSIMQ